MTVIADINKPCQKENKQFSEINLKYLAIQTVDKSSANTSAFIAVSL